MSDSEMLQSQFMWILVISVFYISKINRIYRITSKTSQGGTLKKMRLAEVLCVLLYNGGTKATITRIEKKVRISTKKKLFGLTFYGEEFMKLTKFLIINNANTTRAMPLKVRSQEICEPKESDDPEPIVDLNFAGDNFYTLTRMR
jgi:hypothetical protein